MIVTEQSVEARPEQETVSDSPRVKPLEVATGRTYFRRSLRGSGLRRRDLIGPPLFFGGIVVLSLFALLLLARSAEAPSDETVQDPPARLAPAGSSPAAAVGDAPTSAFLTLSVSPAAALIFVDDRYVGGGPILTAAVEPGYRWITVELVDHVSVDSLVFVAPGDEHVLSLQLSPGTDFDRPSRLAPEDIASPEHEVRRADDQRQPVELLDMAPNPPAPAVASARFSVTVHPSDAVISLNGTPVGAGMVTLSGMAPGDHRLSVERPGHAGYSETVSLAAGDQVERQLTLAPLPPSPGHLHVTVRPWGTIYVNGEQRAVDTDVRFTAELPAGEHVVRAVHPHLGTREVNVVVPASGAATIEIDFTR